MDEKSMPRKKELKKALKIRKKIKKKKPEFKRQENKRYKKLSSVWRKPKGIDSKLKAGKKSRGKTVRPGYSSPAAVRNLSHTGHRIVIVHNPKELNGLNPSEEVAIIASGVGAKKRMEIIKQAEKAKIHVMNSKNRS